MIIAIIGGGISGLSLYLWLDKLGLTKQHDVRIYEARKAGGAADAHGAVNVETYNASVIGASIGLAPNGLKVLKHLDKNLYDDVVSTGHLVKTCRLTNARGWTLADVPFCADGDDMLMLGRNEFWQLLSQRVPENVMVRKKIQKVVIEEHRNSLLFGDGDKADADLVIGADGIWSAVRQAIFDEAGGNDDIEYAPHYEGLVGVGGFVSGDKLSHIAEGEMNIVFGANGFFGYAYTTPSPSTATKHTDRVGWWSTYSLSECPKDWRNIDKGGVNKQLQARHRTWKNETIQNILADVEVSSLYPVFTTPLLPTWARGGCFLVGDAAHALQPSSGQGGSMALEDCEVLALLLNHHLDGPGDLDIGMLMKQYCDLRIPRVSMVHKKAQETGALKQDMSFIQEMIMYFFIWLINRFHLRDSYNRTINNYDGPSEVSKSNRKVVREKLKGEDMLSSHPMFDHHS